MHKEFTFRLFETDFYGQYWQPEEVKAVVVLVHGMGEHSNRYEHVAEKLNKNKYAVVGYDNFGHGRTAGKRGHNPNFEALLAVIDEVIHKAQELYPNKPVFLYGHSMGGNLVVNYTLRKKHLLKGSIATSPFLKLAFQPPAWKMFLGKLLQKIAPSVTLGNELDANHVSRDKEEVRKYIKDPLVHNKISPNYSITVLETGKWAIQNATKLNVPMFLAHGTDDKIIDYKGTESFAEKTNLGSLKLYENGYHELHNDICREELLQDIVTWLNTQLQTTY